MNQHKLNIVESLVKGLCSSYGESRALYRHKLLEAVKTLTDEEFESLNELSKKTLGSYVKKASQSRSDAATNMQRKMKPAVSNGIRDNHRSSEIDKNDIKTYHKRRRGISTAVDKLTK